MIEFQRGAFRVFTGCTGFRRGAKEFLAARDSFVSRSLGRSPSFPPPSPLAPFRFFQPASFIAGARARREEFIPIALSALYYRRRPKESGESSGRIGARAMTARKRVLFFSSTALTLIVLTLRVT